MATSSITRRGRSRQVSDSALARQASEERRVHPRLFIIDSESNSAMPVPPPPPPPLPIAAPVPKRAAYAPPFMRSASPSPPSSASMSPDYYDSPPSPPRSLEDQVHVAYALDDIHLAKILLLRLKGIEVTSDDDPRIAAVQDEDFDFCFVPNGGLMDERDEKAMREMQAREVERLEERRRTERLRQCERKWEDEKRRLREERLAVLRRKEKKKQQEEHETRRAAEEERRRVKRNSSRKLVAFTQPSPSPAPITQTPSRSQFVYDFPLTPGSTPPPVLPPRQTTQTQTQPVLAQTPGVFDDSATVTFNDVLKSMQGALFPADVDVRPRRVPSPKSPSRTHSLPKQRRQDRLLDALLTEIEYNDEERRKRKGKQRAVPRRGFPPCLACTVPSPPPLSPALSSSSSSSIPRTSSWLSFRNSSASSSTTDLTTPSSSPISSSAKPNWFASSRAKSWPSSLRHSCRPHSLMPVAAADSPLPIDSPNPPKQAPISHLGRQRSTSAARLPKDGAGTLVRHMSKFVELAKGFQNAYVTAALFSVAASYDNFEDRDLDTTSSPPPKTPSRSSVRPKLRPAGYRVSTLDVAIFLDPTPYLPSSQISNDIAKSSPTPRYIPLTSPFPLTGTPRTVLPDPLPYRLYFKPVPSPTRSPFRFHALSELHTMYPSSDPAPSATQAPGQVSWRIRSVGNPVHLRLKALHNIVWKRGVQWEGIARETALGGGRERVVGVAYEGIGRSLLTRSPTSLSPAQSQSQTSTPEPSLLLMNN